MSAHVDEMTTDTEAVPPPRRTPWQKRVPDAVLLLLVGAAALQALRLPLGSPSDPGPGMWPLVTTVFAVVTAGICVVRPPEGSERFTRRSWLVLLAALSLILYIMIFPVVGLTVSTALLFLVWIRYFFRERWWATLIAAIAAPIAFYVVFVVLLDVPFPADILDIIFGRGRT